MTIEAELARTTQIVTAGLAVMDVISKVPPDSRRQVLLNVFVLVEGPKFEESEPDEPAPVARKLPPEARTSISTNPMIERARELEASVIVLLTRKPGLSLSKIAASLSRSPSTIHCLLDRLRKRGELVTGSGGWMLAAADPAAVLAEPDEPIAHFTITDAAGKVVDQANTIAEARKVARRLGPGATISPRATA